MTGRMLLKALSLLSLWVCALGSALAGQAFDTPCTISSGGQTTRVREDGSYLLRNIPVGNGLVRVEASCIRDGVTLYGATIFKGLSNGQTVEFGSVPLSPEPIPTVVSIRAHSPGTFTEIGETGQIAVSALLSNGASADVTSPDRGSAYSTSNPEILSVDGQGLVTANGPGVASVTVTNQGASSTVKIAVTFDPLTTLEGFVLQDNGDPAPGALVTLTEPVTESTVTDSNGYFCLGCAGSSLPSTAGNFSIVADVVLEGRRFVAFGDKIPPEPDGVTDAGILTLVSAFALELDGGNDFAEVPSDLFGLGIRNTFTVEIWLRSTSGGMQMLLEDGTQFNTAAFYLGVRPGSNRIFARLNTSNGSVWNDQISVPSFAGEWTHLAMAYDGSRLRVYHQGNTVYQPSISGTILDGNRNLRIGHPSGESFFRGNVDELRIWNVALSTDDLQEQMTRALTGTEPGLVGYWRMNEGLGQALSDETGNGRTGVLGSSSGPDSSDPLWVPSDGPVR